MNRVVLDDSDSDSDYEIPMRDFEREFYKLDLNECIERRHIKEECFKIYNKMMDDFHLDLVHYQNVNMSIKS